MNYQEIMEAIKKAKVIYCYVCFTTNDGHNVQINKTMATRIVKNMNGENTEYRATFYESNNSLYIG